jgi:hypothetical protein
MPSTTSSVVSVRLRLFDGDDSIVTDLVHRVGDKRTDIEVVVRRYRGDLLLLLATCDRPGQRLERFGRATRSPIKPALDVDRARPRHDVANPIGEHGVREDGGSTRAVPHRLGGPFGGLAQHAGTEVLHGILEVELLGDRDAVVADERRAPLPFDEHRLGTRPERNPDRIDQLSSAFENLVPGLGPEENLLVGHDLLRA